MIANTIVIISALLFVFALAVLCGYLSGMTKGAIEDEPPKRPGESAVANCNT